MCVCVCVCDESVAGWPEVQHVQVLVFLENSGERKKILSENENETKNRKKETKQNKNPRGDSNSVTVTKLFYLN